MERGGRQELSEHSKKQGGRSGRVTSLGNQVCGVLFPAQGLVTRQGPSILSPISTPRCALLWVTPGVMPTRKPALQGRPPLGEAGAGAAGNHCGASEGKGPGWVRSQGYRQLASSNSLISPKLPSFPLQASLDPSETIPRPSPPSPATCHKPNPLAPGFTLSSCLQAAGLEKPGLPLPPNTQEDPTTLRGHTQVRVWEAG